MNRPLCESMKNYEKIQRVAMMNGPNEKRMLHIFNTMDTSFGI